jgi:hypothetical protein
MLLRNAGCSSLIFLVAVSLSAADDQAPGAARQVNLQTVVRQADKIVVVRMYLKGPDIPIYSSTKPEEIAELREAIRTGSPSNWPRCACIPPWGIELFKHGKELGTIYIQENLTVGFSGWTGDAGPVSTEKLLRWFDRRGISEIRQFRDDIMAREKAYEIESKRWLEALPPEVQPLWTKLMSESDLWRTSGYADAEAINTLAWAFQRNLPDSNRRIRALFAWFGSGAGPWSGFPAYEVAPVKLLVLETPKRLVGALMIAPPTDQEAEGAVRFFTSYEYQVAFGRFPRELRPMALVPAYLKKELLECILKTGDSDKIRAARAAFVKD